MAWLLGVAAIGSASVLIEVQLHELAPRTSSSTVGCLPDWACHTVNSEVIARPLTPEAGHAQLPAGAEVTVDAASGRITAAAWPTKPSLFRTRAN